MDQDERHGADDFVEFNEPTEYCIYCGDDLDLNIRHYEFHPKTYETKILAVNPKPHDKIIVREGFVHRIEYICNSCLDEEERNS
jgi:hypothetical protein